MPLVGHGEDCCLGDGRVLVDGGLHLRAVHVLAAAEDHVLGPVDQEQEAVLVEIADVPSMEPAVGQHLGVGLRTVQVAPEDVPATNPQFSVASRRLVGAVLGHDAGLHDRTRRPGRSRLGQEVLAGVDGDDAIGLGEAIAGAGAAFHPVFDLLDQVGLHGRTATAERRDAGRVPGGEIRAVQELAGHGGHAGERRRSLPFDEFQGHLGVPAVHQHELSAHCCDRVQAAVAARHVEQRHAQHGAGHGVAGLLVRPGRRLASRHGLGLGARLHHLPEGQVQQVGHRTPMGQHRTLGVPGGARGVEDAGVVVGVDGHGWRCRQIDRRVQGVGPIDGVIAQISPVGPGGHDVERSVGPQHVEVRRHPLEPFAVAQQDLRRRIGQPELHLGAGPPGVHPDHGRSEAHRGPVADNPLRQVAHGQCHPVPVPDAY